MARVKRSVNAHKKRREILEQASGYRGQRSRLYRKAKEQVAHSLGLRLPRPSRPEGRLPQAVDPADQRRGPRGGHDLQPLHLRPQGRRGRGRPQDPRRSRRHRPDRLRPSRCRAHSAGRAPRPETAPTSDADPATEPPDCRRRADRTAPASAGLLRSARRLLRRKERQARPAGSSPRAGRRSPRRLPPRRTCVDLLVADDVVERHAGPARPRSRRRSPASRLRRPPRCAAVSDTVTPQGILAVCRTGRRPAGRGTAPAHPAGRALRPGPRPRQPRYGHPLCRRVRRRCGPGQSRTRSTSTTPRPSGPAPAACSICPLVDRGRSRRQRWPHASTSGLQVLGADGGASCTVDDLAVSGELARPADVGPRQRGLGPAGRPCAICWTGWSPCRCTAGPRA